MSRWTARRNRWTALALLAGALLWGACAEVPAEPVWTKPGASDADREAAFARCLEKAEADDVTTRTERRERQSVDQRGNVFMRCMLDDGWTQIRPE